MGENRHLAEDLGHPNVITVITIVNTVITVIAIVITVTRSYAALRAADLDWIVGPGYSPGG